MISISMSSYYHFYVLGAFKLFFSYSKCVINYYVECSYATVL
jgi:hypothetical protein